MVFFLKSYGVILVILVVSSQTNAESELHLVLI